MSNLSCQFSATGKRHLLETRQVGRTQVLTLCGKKFLSKHTQNQGYEFDGGDKCCSVCSRQHRHPTLLPVRKLQPV